MRIWKWTLLPGYEQTIEMPHGAKILDVQVQNGQPQLWALVDESAYKDRIKIGIYATGAPMPDDLGEYISTFQMNEGSLVFHVFYFPPN